MTSAQNGNVHNVSPQQAESFFRMGNYKMAHQLYSQMAATGQSEKKDEVAKKRLLAIEMDPVALLFGASSLVIILLCFILLRF